MATASGDSQLFEDTFRITAVDQSKYDRVARLSATSEDLQTLMTLDINTELFPCEQNEKLTCVLSTTLNLDGSRDDDKGWRDATKVGGESTLADIFDYVCHGKIYKFEDGEDGQTMWVPPCTSLSAGPTLTAATLARRTSLSAGFSCR